MNKPLDILVVTGAFPLASETFVREQCRSLVELGQNVEVLALRPGDGQWDAADLAVDLPERTSTANIDRRLPERMLLGVPRLMKHGIGSPRLGFNLVRPAHGWRATSGQLLEIASALGGARRFDIIHCQFGPMGRMACLLKKAGLISGEITTTFLGYDITREIKKHGKEVYRELFREARLLLPNSEYLKRLLLEADAPREKVVLHRLGIKVEEFPFVDRTGRTGPLKILAVGRFVEKKGFRYLLHALADVEPRVALECRIIGDGPLMPELKALAAKLELGDSVRFMGWQDVDEVAGAMVEADLLMAPSVTAEDGDMEGMPLVIAEAMSTGLPVIGTRHSGIPEAVHDGENGVLVEERDVGGLANAIGSFSDPGRRLAAGIKSREILAAEFEAQKQAKGLLGLFRGVLGDLSTVKSDDENM